MPLLHCVHRTADRDKDPYGAETTHQHPYDDECIKDDAEHEVPQPADSGARKAKQPADSGAQTAKQPGAELDGKNDRHNP